MPGLPRVFRLANSALIFRRHFMMQGSRQRAAVVHGLPQPGHQGYAGEVSRLVAVSLLPKGWKILGVSHLPKCLVAIEIEISPCF